LRLLLDEHYARDIAGQLRTRGHDVVAVTERADLIAISDADLFRLMTAEKRAIVTENVGDFMPLVQGAAAASDDHFGVVFTSHASMPRSNATIGLYVRILDEFLTNRGAENALMNQTYWLP
jgi:hypothetical protein